jgi:hypothetical protein
MPSPPLWPRITIRGDVYTTEAKGAKYAFIRIFTSEGVVAIPFAFGPGESNPPDAWAAFTAAEKEKRVVAVGYHVDSSGRNHVETIDGFSY